MSNDSQGNHPFFNHVGGVFFIFLMVTGSATWLEGWGERIGVSVVIWLLIWAVYQMGKGSS
jgi:hypothetical protein